MTENRSEATNQLPAGAGLVPALGINKYLSFAIGDDVYGVTILSVKEIIEYVNVATVPMVPPYIRGVINLRGNVVPVIGLAERMGVRGGEISKRTCIVVVEVESEGEKIDVGVVVDSVNAVVDLGDSDIEQAPAFGSSIPVEYIEGMGRVDRDFVVLLSLRQVLDIEDLSALDGRGADRSESAAV